MKTRDDVVSDDELSRVKFESGEEMDILLGCEFREESVLKHELVRIRSRRDVDGVPRRSKAGHEFQGSGRLPRPGLALQQEEQGLSVEQFCYLGGQRNPGRGPPSDRQTQPPSSDRNDA